MSNSDSDSSPKSPNSGSGFSSGGDRPIPTVHVADPGSPSNAHQSSDESSGSSDGVLVELPTNPDQDSRDGGILVNIDGSMQEGREDLFVDAPDELLPSARSSFGELARFASEGYGESSTGRTDGPDRIRHRLDETLAQCSKFKEERDDFGREVSGLRHLLQVMLDQQSLPTARNEFHEHLHEMEREDSEDEDFMSAKPLHSMVNDCSKLTSHLKNILDEHSESEGTIRELHSHLYTKDQELEELNVKLTESIVSRDVTFSYFGSLPHIWSESLRQSSYEFSRRLLASLETVVGQDRSLLEDSVDVVSLVENRILYLLEKHARLLSDTQQLRHLLAETRPELLTSEESESGLVYSIACEELLESKRREALLSETIWKFEQENKKMAEDIDRVKEGLEMANAETNKAKKELEQSENKLAAAREKLSIAVTKGKSLVQHRDSLKQSLAEKTINLEKYMLELQQKSSALEASEASTEAMKRLVAEKTGELEKNMLELQQKSSALEAIEISGAELKQLLAEKTDELEKCFHELQHKSDVLGTTEASVEELKQSLAEKTGELDRCLLELRQKADALENTEIDSKELKQLLAVKTNELNNCLMELQQKSKTLEVTEARSEELGQTLAEKSIELEKSLLEIQQKSYALETSEASVTELQQSLAERTNELNKYLLELQQKSETLQLATITNKELDETQNIVNSLRDLLSSRDMVLHDIEEVMKQNDSHDEVLSLEVVDRVRWFVDQKHKSDGVLMERNKVQDVLSTINLPKNVSSTELDIQVDWLVKSFVQAKEDIVKMQEEISVAQADVASHETELVEVQKEINHLAASLLEVKQEKDLLQDTHGELKCKYEKIVKRLSSIYYEEGLMKELTVSSGNILDDQLSRDTDMLIDKFIGTICERMNNAEREQFEEMQSLLYVKCQELMLCEKMLEEQTIGRLEMTTLSNELETASQEIYTLRNDKESMQKELERLEERSSLLREKLSMAVKKGKGLVQEREGFKQSLDEKNSEIEKLKQELQIQESAIAEYKEQIKGLSAYPEHVQGLESEIASLKDLREQKERSLLESNNTLQNLVNCIDEIVLPTEITFEKPVEKMCWIAEYIHESEAEKTQREQELEKVKDEATMYANRLAVASQTLKALEGELSKAEEQICGIAEENKDIHLGKAKFEQELKKVKEEGYIQAIKLQDASATIKSLQDELAEASRNISILEGEKAEAESKRKEEVTSLNAKLAECMKELVETRGSLENRSGELASQLAYLQMLIKNQDLLSLTIEEFWKKIEDLRNMGILVQDLHDRYVAKGLHTDSEVLASPQKFEDFACEKMFSDETSTEELDDPTSFTKIAERLQSRAKHLSDRFESLSNYMDSLISITSQALQALRDDFIHMLEFSASLKLNVNKLEAYNHAQEIKLLSIEKEAMTLLSACNEVTQKLQIEFIDVLDFDMDKDMIKLSKDSRLVEEVWDAQEAGNGGEYAKAAGSLLLAAKRISIQAQHLVNAKRTWITSIDDLRHKLNQADLTAESALQDRHLSQERLLKLEEDLEELQNVCKEMKLDIEGYQAKEDMLRDKEAQFPPLQNALTAEGRGIGVKFFSESQLETVIEKVNKIAIPSNEFAVQSQEDPFTSPVDKLFYVLDNFVGLLHKVDSLTTEKEDTQLILESYVHEVEHQKRAAETTRTNYQDFEAKKADLLELTSGLEKMVQRFGGNNSFEDQRMTTTKGLLQVVERLLMTLYVELENSKSRMQELGAKLQVKEKYVDELSAKNKLLEDSIHDRLAQPDTIKERTVFEASTSAMGSEISEIEDVVPLSKSSISSPAAHVRTMRKGSNDHLVLSIDSESERLIASRETDDKGHIFKSLNTSGLIPKQGKLIADRIDGIWVSGGQVLMRRPGARLGLIVYSILLHLLLLGTTIL